MSIDWENRCAHCGAIMGDVVHLRREYCGKKCYGEHYRAMQREAREAEKAGRPCAVCGDPIPATLRADATHCSEACKRKRVKRQKKAIACGCCGAEFFPLWIAAPAQRKYCSRRCARAMFRAPLTIARLDRMLGG